MIQTKKQYETTFIVNASLEDPQIETIISQASEIITRNGGEMTSVNRWARKRLAYTIKKRNNGYYVNLEYDATGSLIPQLERMLSLDENILRYLTVQVSKKAIQSRQTASALQAQNEIVESEAPKPEPLFGDDEEPIPPAAG